MIEDPLNDSLNRLILTGQGPFYRRATKPRRENLLADRFKLTTHFVKAEVVGYEMTVAKGGLKLKAAAPNEKRLRPGMLSSGTPIPTYSPSYRLQDLHSMEQLASFLSFFLDWPVVDKMGLAGMYEVDLRMETNAPPPMESIRDRLGLILERTKSVVDVLVIDHAEKTPTPNPRNFKPARVAIR